MKTKFYKIIYFCFAFCLMLSTASILSGFMQAGNTSESWAASAVEPTRTLSRKDQDDGVTRTYTLIESEGNLAWLMMQTSSTYFSKNYLLTKNLDMANATWTAIGAYSTSTKTYSGVFNGDGNFIKGLSCSVTTSYAGLFAQVSGIVKNVYLENSSFKSTYYAGSIAAYVSSGTIKNCGVYNCSVTAEYSSGSSIYAGGVAGYVGSGTIQRVDCSGSGTIKGDQPSSKSGTSVYVYTGGVAGYLNTGSVKSCYNSNYVNSWTFPRYAYTGGIVGYSSGTVSECINKGNIKAGDSSACDISYAGGVAGYSAKNISNCSNFGDIESYAKNTTTQEDSYKQTSWDDWGFCGSFDIYRKCDESSRVKENKAYAGGIVGFLDSNKSITYCYNTASTIRGGGKYFSYSGSFGSYAKNDRWILSDQVSNTVSLTSSRTYLIKQYRDAICGNSRVSNSSGQRTVTLSNCYSVNDFDNFYDASGTLIKDVQTYSGTAIVSYDGSEKCRIYWKTGPMQSYGGCEYGRCILSINSSGGTNGTEAIAPGYILCYDDNDDTHYEKVLSKAYTTKSTGIKSINLGSLWTTDSTINDGYPFPKSMYWKYN